MQGSRCGVALLKSPFLGPGPYRKLLPCTEPPFGSLPVTEILHGQKVPEPWQKRLPCLNQGIPVLRGPKTIPLHTGVWAGVGLVGTAHLWWWVGEARAVAGACSAVGMTDASGAWAAGVIQPSSIVTGAGNEGSRQVQGPPGLRHPLVL